MVRTDHHSLTWLLSFNRIEGQLARWIEELSQYDMEVQHRPGRKHGNTDALSRIPDNIEYCAHYQSDCQLQLLSCGGCNYCARADKQWSHFSDAIDDIVPIALLEIQVDEIDEQTSLSTTDDSVDIETWVDVDSERIQQAQQADDDIKSMMNWVLTGTEPNAAALFLSSPSLKYLGRKQHVIHLKVLYCRYEHPRYEPQSSK